MAGVIEYTSDDHEWNGCEIEWHRFPEQYLSGIDGTSDGYIYAVGAKGVVLRATQPTD